MKVMVNQGIIYERVTVIRVGLATKTECDKGILKYKSCFLSFAYGDIHGATIQMYL